MNFELVLRLLSGGGLLLKGRNDCDDGQHSRNENTLTHTYELENTTE